MRKHRFKNKLNSIFGSHIDPGKDEELKGSNVEMEDNYKKILELLKEEDQDDRNKLIGLIEDFHKHHQSIYERYDHITGELRAKVHSKKEKDSSSSSSSDSDSDSDDSSSKKVSKNGKLKVAGRLKEELQAANEEISELTRKLAIATEENEALSSECRAALNKVQETEKMFGELKLEADRLHEENSKLLADHSQKVEDISSEKTSLTLERETALGTIEELKTVIVRLEGEKDAIESELGVVKAEFSEMKEKLETTDEELSSICQTLEASEAEKNSLADEIKTRNDEIQELATECSRLREKLAGKENELLSHIEMHDSHKNEVEIKVRGFEENLETLHFQKREIEKQKEEEFLTLTKTFEDKERESLSQIKLLTENVSNLQQELDSLNIQKSKLEEHINEKQEEIASLCSQKLESESQLEKSCQEISGYLTQIDSLKLELASRTENERRLLEEKDEYAARMKDLEEELKTLHSLKTESETELSRTTQEISEYRLQIENLREEVAKMTLEKEGYESKVKDQELKLESLNDLKNELEKQLEKKGVDISELLIMNQSLKEELESKSKDQAKMEEEKEVYESKVKDLELKLESLNNLKSESEMQLEKKGLEFSELLILSQSLKEELESKSKDQAKMVEEKEVYESKVKDLELKLESSNNLKNESELQLKKKGVEISELLILSQSLKEELESKSKDQAKTLEEKEGCESRVKDLELKLESLNKLKNESEMKLDKKGVEISELVILNQNLEEELESKSKDLGKTAEEKDVYESKVKDLESELESLNNLKNESEMQLEKKGIEISELLILNQNLKEELEGKLKDLVKTVEEKEVCESKVKDLEVKLELLNDLKNESEMQLKQKGVEISELLILSQTLKEEVESKSKDQAKIVEEKKVYESKVEDLQLKLESLNELKTESEMQLEKKGREISELLILNQSLKDERVEEKERYESKVKDLELKLDDLKSELEMQNEKKGLELSEVLLLSQTLKEELEIKSKDQAKTMEEKEISATKVNELEKELNLLAGLKQENLKLQKQLEERIQELEAILVEKGDELSKHIVEENEASAQIAALKEQVTHLHEQITSLSAQKNEMESEKLKLETALKSQDDDSNKLNEEKKRLEACLKEAELKTKEMEEAIEDLRGDVEIKGDEIVTLTETVRNLEVKIRLANQKLRVTEQTLNEKENDHACKEEKLHEENKSLVDKITSYKETEARVRKEVAAKVNEISTDMDSLTVKFEEDHGHISTQIYEIMNEIQVAKISIKEMGSERDDLKEKVAKTVMKLKMVEGENEGLKKSVDELQTNTTRKDEKIKELENTLYVKDEGIVDLREEKREAIRQLCMWVDYQRDRYDHLQQLLSKATTVRRR